MPTVLTIDGLRVVIYPNDHEPAHVHVIGDGNEARFALQGADGMVELIENYGFRGSAIARIKVVLTGQQHALIAKWSEIHGQD